MRKPRSCGGFAVGSCRVHASDWWPQMLVYENYNKFISATDTIRSMKVNVEGMDAGMQDLRTRLGAP